MAERVELYEVGARDGLQNEARNVPTEEKIRLIDLLSDCGFERIEVSSFVSPRWVPQMADATDVFAGIRRRSGVRYGALAPNLRGLDAALAANAGEVAIFGSASEGFSRKNIGCSVEESFARFAPVLERARAVGIPVRGYVSCVVACPFDGPVAPGAVPSADQDIPTSRFAPRPHGPGARHQSQDRRSVPGTSRRTYLRLRGAGPACWRSRGSGTGWRIR